MDAKEDTDRCYIVTSAHVAPPGWKVSVTFPASPDRERPAAVVGHKLMSDLALFRVEAPLDDSGGGSGGPGSPLPLVLSSEEVSTDAGGPASGPRRAPSAEMRRSAVPSTPSGTPWGSRGPP